ncbi:MAG: ATP-binding protein [Kofleriaceae bacterium]
MSPLPKARSLASRLVLLGIAQLALITVTAIGIFIAQGPYGEPRPEDHVDLRKLEMLTATPDALSAALEQLRRDRIEISLYDAKRQLIATNVDPPLAIPARWRNRDRDRGGPQGPSPDGLPPGGPPGGPPHDDRPPPPGGPPHDDRPPPPPHDDRPPPGGPPHDDPPPPPGGPPLGGDEGLPGEGGPRGEGPGGSDLDGPRRRPPAILAARFGPNRDKTLLLPFRPLGDRENRGVLVARGVHGEKARWVGPVFMIVSGLVILVLGAIVTARYIVRPIDRLAKTARDLGAGDLSARSRLGRSDEIGELGQRFDEMADRIQVLMRSEKELFANIAHELRTPLSRIGVALDLATEGDAAAARASLAEIAVDVSELETIVDDILSTLRFEIADRTGGVAQLPLRRSRVVASSIARAAEDRMRSRHPSRPFEATIADALPLVDVDQVLVRRVLDNLLENAHKYSPDPEAKITLDARRDGDRVVYTVRDRGAGIPAKDLPMVFAAFFRGERSRSRETGGVGLGLTLAKRIVDAHDGTIEVESTLGKGTTVTVAIPTVA